MGVAASVKADIGVFPVSAIPYVTSRILNIDMGITTATFFCSLVIFQAILLRKNFKILSLFQILVASLFGYFVSFCNSLLRFDAPEFYPWRIILHTLGILLLSFGVMLYLAASIVPQPPEGVLLAINQISGWRVSTLKIVFDCSLVIICLIISSIFMGTPLYGIREGTIMAAVGIGYGMSIFNRLFLKGLTAFMFQSKPPP